MKIFEFYSYDRTTVKSSESEFSALGRPELVKKSWRILYAPLVRCSERKYSLHGKNFRILRIPSHLCQKFRIGIFYPRMSISSRNLAPVVLKISLHDFWPVLVALRPKIPIRNFWPWCDQMRKIRKFSLPREYSPQNLTPVVRKICFHDF